MTHPYAGRWIYTGAYMLNSKMNALTGIPLPEIGKCACGQTAVLRFKDNKYEYVCDECREYFKAGFNVEV